MDKVLSVEELLRDAPSYDGQRIALAGQFIATPEVSVLCSPRAALGLTPAGRLVRLGLSADRRRIVLDHPDLAERCLAGVSAYAGGPWYYHDAATVRGRFVAAPTPTLTDLTELVIRRGERTYPVAL